MDFDINMFKRNVKFCLWLEYARTKKARDQFKTIRGFIRATPKNITINNFVTHLVKSYEFGEVVIFSEDTIEPARKANQQINDILRDLSEYDHLVLQMFALEVREGLVRAHKRMNQHLKRFYKRTAKSPTSLFKNLMLHGLISAKGNWNTFEQLKTFLNQELPTWVRTQDIEIGYNLYSAGSENDLNHSWARSLKSQLMRNLNEPEHFQTQVSANPNDYERYFEIDYQEVYDYLCEKYLEK